jgi:hypothetical protein
MSNQDDELKTADQFIEAAIAKANDAWAFADDDERKEDLLCAAAYGAIAIALMMRDSRAVANALEREGKR